MLKPYPMKVVFLPLGLLQIEPFWIMYKICRTLPSRLDLCISKEYEGVFCTSLLTAIIQLNN